MLTAVLPKAETEVGSLKEYLIAFSSFYKAAYGQEILAKEGIKSTLEKTPVNLMRSCGYSLLVKTDDLENLKRISRNSAMGIAQIFEKKN